ncbi:DUF1990 family protein [Jatrophihabitans sp.]|uniref:DUF1990 family protein n=1 Tax=Jatrophihabitans sp. TaxID=1932789 RepID=UPI002C1CD580|nr:DUF1990 domain-containing protein [Jatrophihabitans sp.]
MAGSYHEMALSGSVGRGAAAFSSASAAVLSLRMHRKAGVRMTMPGDRVKVGDVVRIAFGIGPLAIHGSCDVVWVAEEARKAGFRYRTRPDHPEDGEESFVVAWAGNDEVIVRIDSRARPQKLIMRLVGPLGRLGALLVNRRYLWAVRRIVAAETAASQAGPA